MNKLKKILILSIIINFLFILSSGLIVYKKGGTPWLYNNILLVFSSGSGNSNNISNNYTPYYRDKVDLFSKLPIYNGCVVFLGDSITEYCEWDELFRSDKIVNRGIRGDTTDGVLNRINQITQIKPSKIFIMVGINDLSKGKSTSSIIQNYEDILTNIQQNSPNTKVIIQSVLPINNSINHSTLTNNKVVELNSGLKTLAEKFNANYINIYDLLLFDESLNPSFTSDGTHLNGEGYLIWSKAIEKCIE